jgi:hypothetical protein
MRAAAWNTFVEGCAVLRVVLDRIVHATGPAAIAFGGEAPLFYFALVILSAQLWRIDHSMRQTFPRRMPSRMPSCATELASL